MENNSRNRSLTVIAALAVLAILLTLVLRDTATTYAARKQQVTRKLTQTGSVAAGSDAVADVTSAPYRDGLFEGKLAQERGEAGHVSAGRWSSQLDRSAYTGGYLEGFGSLASHTSRNAAK